MSANVETMMWVGDKKRDMPWHMTPERYFGYGGVDPLTAAETIRLAGLDWRVDLRPAAVVADDGVVHQSDEILCLVRDQDHKILGTCTERYGIIQNSEAFDFLDTLVGEGIKLRYVTAGAIAGGKRIWLLAQLQGDGFSLEPILGDKVNTFLMLTTGHDGKTPLKCKFTSVRIVCQNTLTLALRTGDKGVTIRHTGDHRLKLTEARKVLGLATEEANAFRNASEWLANLRVDKDYIVNFLEEMAPTEDKEEKATVRAKNLQGSLLDLVMNGRGTHVPGVLGTRWGLLNAVTEYNSHHRNYRNTKENGQDTTKFDALFEGGVGERMNAKALDFLLADAPEDIKPVKPKAKAEPELENA